MNYLHAAYLIVGALIAIFLEWLSISSLRENQLRAATRGSSIFIIFALLWFGGYFILSPSDTVLLFALAVVIIFTALFFAPLGRIRSMKIGEITERFDERDVVFAREDYQPGTWQYEQYYARRPQFKQIDDKLRKLPELLEPGGRYYDPEQSPRIDSIFEKIERLTTEVDGAVASVRQNADAAQKTDFVKQKLIELGADEVGIAELNPMYVYSHVGRGPHTWGEPITNNHRFVIAFTLEMRYDPVQTAPTLPITEETAHRYLRAARISVELADMIRNLGYPARAHISGSNYQVILPAVAYDAGLGELGRLGYLISPKFGARIRLGAVTTDLPLMTDQPISFGVQDFCARCRKCSTNCPPGAIPLSRTSNIRGVSKWPLNAEQCLYYWRVLGTDCGICMKVCPFSHPPTFVHNLVRAGIRRSSFARWVSVWADDFLYGAKTYVP